MPTNRRYRMCRRTPAYTPEMILSDADLRHHVETGRPYFAGFATVEEFADGWEAVRDVVLEDFVSRHPGRRPFAWWLLDHGTERPLLVDPLYGEPVTREHALSYSGVTFGFAHTHTVPPMQ